MIVSRSIHKAEAHTIDMVKAFCYIVPVDEFRIGIHEYLPRELTHCHLMIIAIQKIIVTFAVS